MAKAKLFQVIYRGSSAGSVQPLQLWWMHVALFRLRGERKEDVRKKGVTGVGFVLIATINFCRAP